MKYIIDIPNADVSRWIGETPLGKKLYVPISVEDGNEYNIATGIYAEEYTEPDRKAIEDEVWATAIKIDTVSDNWDWQEMPYQEAKAKYEEWKKQKDDIHVGDEVTFEMAFGNGLANNMKAVALDQAAAGEEWCVLTENGCVETYDEEDLYKTGRHFPEVAELLKKMKKEECSEL